LYNGAQTVSAIGKHKEAKSESLDNVWVQVRVIVSGDDRSFGEEVTRTNNRQNRIENRDFVALDRGQIRIKTDLAISGIDYQLVRSETSLRSERSFDLVEATVATACAFSEIRMAVQAKREIGKLWEDIGKAPYKELFNASTQGIYVWRCVQAHRSMDVLIDRIAQRRSSDQHSAIATHGNRFIAALIFRDLPVNRFADPEFDFDEFLKREKFDKSVNSALKLVTTLIDRHYPNSMLPQLFKNISKCEHLIREAIGLNTERLPQTV